MLSVGGYNLIRELGKGGMGRVYLGESDGTRDRPHHVAVKRMGDHLFGDPKERALFLREVRIMSRIRHPNVVSSLDVIEVDGIIYHVMEFVDGVSLYALLHARADRGSDKHPPMPVPIAVRIAGDILRGLSGAHGAIDEDGRELNVVHRDVSPQNVLVGFDGFSRVVDFGIAKTSTQETTKGASNFRGKIRYVAPEQIKGEPVDHRTDIYSAAVAIWESLAGSPLFFAETTTATLARVLMGKIPDLREHNPRVPVELEALLRRALSSNLETRPEDAAAFADELERCAPPATREEVGSYVLGSLPPEEDRPERAAPAPTNTVSAAFMPGTPLGPPTDDDDDRTLVEARNQTRSHTEVLPTTFLQHRVDPTESSRAEPSVSPRRRRWLLALAPILLLATFGVVWVAFAARATSRDPGGVSDDMPTGSDDSVTASAAERGGSPSSGGATEALGRATTPVASSTNASEPTTTETPRTAHAAPAVSASTRRAPSTSAPRAPKSSKPDCRVPTFLDERGIRRIRKECIEP